MSTRYHQADPAPSRQAVPTRTPRESARAAGSTPLPTTLFPSTTISGSDMSPWCRAVHSSWGTKEDGWAAGVAHQAMPSTRGKTRAMRRDTIQNRK